MTRFSIIEEELLARAKLALKEKLDRAVEDIEEIFEVYAPPDAHENEMKEMGELAEIRSILANLVADEEINDRIRHRACAVFVERSFAEPGAKGKVRPKREEF